VGYRRFPDATLEKYSALYRHLIRPFGDSSA
jgi:hypothetical protein